MAEHKAYIAWTKTVKGETRFMVVDHDRVFPDNVSWTTNIAMATAYNEEKYHWEIINQLRSLPGRRFMGKIFPSIPIAIAMDLNSDPGTYEAIFGVGEVVFNPCVEKSRRFGVTILVDGEEA